MTSPLERLTGAGKPLAAEPPDAKEFEGLKRSGLARLKDAANAVNALESRFDLGYNAAHALCLAALRHKGFRPHHRYIVFQVLVAEAATGHEAIKQFRAHRPDVTLMDLNLPQMSGLDAISLITREFPDARIVVLTTDACDAQVLRALKAGVSGYLLKSTLHRELIAAIRAVHTGKKFLSAEVTFELAEHLSDDPLTSTEIGVLRLIAEGMANKEIAADLSMSESTVKGHVRSLLSKLGVNDRTHAAMVALKRGIIKMPTG